MNLYGYEIFREDDLMHHGIKGQKWGQRRFQNEDGTWTAAGKVRYGDDGSTGANRGSFGSRANSVANTKNTPEAKARSEKLKKAAKIGAVVAGTALVAYGAYKLNKALDSETSKRYKQYSDSLFDKYSKYEIKARGMELAGKSVAKVDNQLMSSKEARSIGNIYYKGYREANQKAYQGSYSLGEKLDTAKRLAKNMHRR